MKIQQFWVRSLVLLIFTMILSVFVSMDAKAVSQISLIEQSQLLSVQQRVLVLTVPLGLALSLSLLKRRHAQKVRVRKSRDKS